MKRFLKCLLFFTLIANTCFGQYAINFPYQAKYTAAALSANINFTDTGNPSGVTGWTDVNLSTATTPVSIANGWTIQFDNVSTNVSINFFANSSFAFGNADFPDAVLKTYWYYNGISTSHLNIVIHNLDPTKTYNIKIATADTGSGDGPTDVTIGTTTLHGVDPNGIVSVLSFTGVSPTGGGNLVILVVPGTGGSETQVNGLIIMQN